VVEDLGLAGPSGRNQVLVKNIENIVANLGELCLDLLSVLLDESNLGRVALRLLLLLNRSNYPPRGTAGTDDILVGDGKKVTLLDGQIAVLRGDNLHVLNHLWKWVAKAVSASLPHGPGMVVRHHDKPSYRSACSASLAR
jgi:hypothetical protein